MERLTTEKNKLYKNIQLITKHILQYFFLNNNKNVKKQIQHLCPTSFRQNCNVLDPCYIIKPATKSTVI